ncbi:MAG: OB-fold domain-containing protein [Pseudomonadota bacterium]
MGAQQVPVAEGLFTWPSANPQLIGSRCNNCGAVAFPAQKSCAACCSVDVEEMLLSRTGKLWTWTIQGFLPKSPPYSGPETIETFKPFGVGYVELPEEVKVEARFKMDNPEALEIGMEMELVIDKFKEDEDGNDVMAFFFRPVN